MKFRGIARQMAWLTLLPIFLLVLVMEGYFIRERFADIDRSLLERGSLIARQLASGAEYGVFANNHDALNSLSLATMRQPDVRGLAILDASSQLLIKHGEMSGTLSSAVGQAVIASSAYPGLQSPMRFETQVNLVTPVRSDAQSVWIYQPIVPAQVDLGGLDNLLLPQQIGAVVVEMSREQGRKEKNTLLLVTVLGTLVLLAIALYLVYLASRSITLPIRRLSAVVRTVEQGNLSARANLDTNIDELHVLGGGFDRMAEQLQQERAALQERIAEATQALREKKEQAELANQEKSRFLAVASHDLRQPLHALGLYIADLKRKVGSKELSDIAVQAEQSVDALANLLNALLDITRLDAGGIVPQLQACDMHLILERVAADAGLLARMKGVRLVVHSFKGTVHSDPMLLERILMNLISNAIRYTHSGGCVLVGCRKRGGQLRIEVRDNGIGIAKQDQQNIFREFFRLSQATLGEGRGIGLGLSIVDRLVKLLEHKLTLNSAPGRGSLFALDVPLLVTRHAVREVAREPSGQDAGEYGQGRLQGRRVLVVDDDEMVLLGTAGLLASWGCTVDRALALERVNEMLAEGLAWDIVVSDWQLEGGYSGIDVITAVRQRTRADTPCVLVSGDTSPAVLKLASVGGHHLLHKPVKPAKLRSLLAHLLEMQN